MSKKMVVLLFIDRDKHTSFFVHQVSDEGTYLSLCIE
jgi:hypothetical protein